MTRRLSEEIDRWPDLSVEPLDTQGIQPRDAAFAHALYDAAIRRWVTVEWFCNEFSRKPMTELEPRVQAALISGGTQLIALGSVPAHAAIDESVRWAKRNVRDGAGGLVNALLRRISDALDSEIQHTWTGERDLLPIDADRCLTLVGGTLPTDFEAAASVAFGLPLGLIEALVDEHGRERLISLGLHALSKPPAIVDLGELDEIPNGIVPHEEPGYGVWVGERGGLSGVLSIPGVWAQDPSSGGAIASISDLAPERIVDLCAGMGTKTRQLARCFPNAKILATDTDETRLRTLDEVFRDHPRVRVCHPDEVEQLATGNADLVLLDVPCSNSGVLARRVEARHRLTQAAIDRLTQIQHDLLTFAGSLLSDRGCVLYATCSVHRAENQDAAAVAQAKLSLEAIRERQVWPSGTETSSRDGAYSVLLTGPGRLGWG